LSEQPLFAGRDFSGCTKPFEMLTGRPSFNVTEFETNLYYTFIEINNNGTGKAHNIKLELKYRPQGSICACMITTTQFVPELDNNTNEL
jgi:hypothetical protein